MPDALDIPTRQRIHGDEELRIHENKILDGFLDISLPETDQRMTQPEVLEIVFLANLEGFFLEVRAANLVDKIRLGLFP